MISTEMVSTTLTDTNNSESTASNKMDVDTNCTAAKQEEMDHEDVNQDEELNKKVKKEVILNGNHLNGHNNHEENDIEIFPKDNDEPNGHDNTNNNLEHDYDEETKQELKKLFETANKGEISLDSFMNNKIVKKFVDVYQGADSGMKIFADKFYKGAFGTAMKAENPALLQKGTKAYDEFMVEVKDWYSRVAKQDFLDKNYLTNELKTPAEILGDMSAFLVKNTMPTYSMVPKAVRATRELPFGNFASFPSEILRNGANIISIGARELTSANPLIRQMGARRLIGASATFGGIGAVVQQTAQAITGVNQDIMDSFQRSFAPEYQKNSTFRFSPKI